MATKAKHAKRSGYSSHNYKAFPMFERSAFVKNNAVYVTSHAVKQTKKKNSKEEA